MKALIVVTNHDQIGNTGRKTGWYLPEVSHIFYPLFDSGFEIDFASPRGGFAPMDEKSRNLEDPLNARFVREDRLKDLDRTLSASEIDPAQYQVIFFAGGHGTMWDFREARGLQDVAARIYENGGIVSAVCHGPAGIIDIKLANGNYLVDGKEVSAFTNEEETAVGLNEVVPYLLEDELRKNGAILRESPMWANRVIVSERLVTGQNPQSALSLGRAVAELAKQL